MTRSALDRVVGLMPAPPVPPTVLESRDARFPRIELSARLHRLRDTVASMRELRPGVWHWQSSHPGWDEEQDWPKLVSSYGIELGDDFLLFDS